MNGIIDMTEVSPDIDAIFQFMAIILPIQHSKVNNLPDARKAL